MDGKKTYSFIAGILISAAAGYATRHGVDLGPITPDLTDVLVAILGAGAAWARSVAKLPPVVVPVQDKQRRTVADILKDQK